MDVIGWIHTGSALAALLLGPAVFFRVKGDRYHCRIGYAYALSMIVLNLTALLIYDLFGGWGPFHWMALVSLATLMAGLVPAVWRTKNWLEAHYQGMCWSCVGLAAAGAAELFTRVPDVWPSAAKLVPAHYFWVAVGVSVVVTGGVGTYMIRVKRMGFPANRTALTESAN